LILELGDYVESEELLRHVLEVRSRLYGKDHPDTFTSKINLLGVLHRDPLRLPEAAKLGYTLLEDCRRVLGEEHPTTLFAKSSVAGFLMSIGVYPKAEALYREVLKIERRLYGNNYADAFVAAVNLGLTLKLQEKLSQAEAHFKEEIAMADHCLPRTHTSRASLHAIYGNLLQENGRYEEAEHHLLVGYEALKNALGTREIRTRSAIEALAELYEAWGKPDRSAEYRALLTLDWDCETEH
jgi:hypothetical protein